MSHSAQAAYSYLLAVDATAAAVAVRWLLDPWLGGSLVLVTLFAAVALAAWYAGSRPAVLATFLGYLSCAYLFAEPRSALVVGDPALLIELFAFAASSGVLIMFAENARGPRWLPGPRPELPPAMLPRYAAPKHTAGDGSAEPQPPDEETFRTLADNIDQLAWMCDRLGHATWYNRRWYDYTGSTFAEMRGEGWKRVHHPDHLERVVKGLERCVASGVPWEDTFPLRGKDGSYRWFLSRSIPIRDDDGRVRRWFGTNTDITTQRELEDALRDAHRRKDEFLATVAHELRNPLAPILNAVRILQHDDERNRDWALGILDRQVGRMTRLLDDLLDVSRISHGKLELRKQRIDLSAVVRSAIETSRPLIEQSKHELSVALPAEPLHLEADPERLAQVLSNLLNNAAKYTDSGGRIQIAAERRNGEVMLSVRDNGIGIAPEVLPRIFEIFAQEKGALERSQGGLGIGLSLVRGLVDLHGGRIEARSEGRGKGSEFVVYLPHSPGADGGMLS